MKLYNPTSPGRRGMTKPDFSVITKKYPEKSLLASKKQRAGRAGGKIAVRHQGGGHKQRYRLVDFKMNRFDIEAKVIAIEYDPNRTANIALICYTDGVKSYVLAPDGLNVGDTVISSMDKKIPLTVGNRMTLENLPTGSLIYNIELMPGKGGSIVRSAGAMATLLAKEGKYATVQLPSTEVRKVLVSCMANLGQVGNKDHSTEKIGKAGRSRWMGIRPTVRGSAMNPVDHPHGGGEGRQPVGLRRSKTPWGKTARGVKTRRKKRISNKFILSRRKSKQ